MLILTTRALGEEGELARFDAWPGPKILLVDPEHRMPWRKTQELCETFVVLEYLDVFPGALAALREIASLPGVQAQEGWGPMLYLDRPTCGMSLGEVLQELGQSPYAMRSEISDSGSLEMLLLGEMIAGSPLLNEVYDFLYERSINDETFVEMLDQTFAQR